MKFATTAATAIGLAAAAFVTVQASAEELWDPHLRGVDEGMALGEAPPPGVYGVLNNYWTSFAQYDNNGNKTGVKVQGIVEVPVLLWSTGLKVFGADYSVGVAQPFDYTNLKIPNVAALSANGHMGTYNTILMPAILAWKLPGGFHVSTSLAVYLDDASSSPGDPSPSGGCGAGNGYMTLEPGFAVSWIQDGWNATLSTHYAHPFENGKTHYRSGDEISLDYTLTKDIGKWIVGVGAYQQVQIQDDSGAGAIAENCPAKGGCKVSIFGAGPLVGYKFGGIELLAAYNANIYARNDMAGTFVNVRMVAPL